MGVICTHVFLENGIILNWAWCSKSIVEIPGRPIWDNIHTVHNVLQSQADITKGGLIFLDMEKAYDCINWEFLFKCLDWVGIPPQFIGWLGTLYTDLEAQALCGSRLSSRI